MTPPKTLRDLRLWHWMKVMGYRQKERENTARAEAWELKHNVRAHLSISRANLARAHGDWHLSAVIALNDVVTGTAEDDAREVAAGRIVQP